MADKLSRSKRIESTSQPDPGSHPATNGHMEPELPEAAPDSPCGDEGATWVRPCVSAAGPGGRNLSDDLFQSRYPSLFDWLTRTGMGGLTRRPGTFTITSIRGSWKVSLTEHDEGAWAYVISEDTLFEVLAYVDKALKMGWLTWQPSRYKAPVKKGRGIAGTAGNQ